MVTTPPPNPPPDEFNNVLAGDEPTVVSAANDYGFGITFNPATGAIVTDVNGIPVGGGTTVSAGLPTNNGGSNGLNVNTEFGSFTNGDSFNTGITNVNTGFNTGLNNGFILPSNGNSEFNSFSGSGQVGLSFGLGNSGAINPLFLDGNNINSVTPSFGSSTFDLNFGLA